MTDQELYTITRNHLLKQMAKSLLELGSSETCAYRGVNGLKCAIGIHIPDKKYSKDLEGKGVYQGIVARAAGIGYTSTYSQAVGRQIQLAAALQAVHDSHEPDRWKEVLDNVATRFGLKVEA